MKRSNKRAPIVLGQVQMQDLRVPLLPERHTEGPYPRKTLCQILQRRPQRTGRGCAGRH